MLSDELLKLTVFCDNKVLDLNFSAFTLAKCRFLKIETISFIEKERG